MPIQTQQNRDARTRRANLIEFAFSSLRNRKWLISDDLIILEDIFQFVKADKNSAWYEINSILWFLTNLALLNPTDGRQTAKLVAEVENHAEKHNIQIYSDTVGQFTYKDFSIYHQTRKFCGKTGA